MKPKFRAWTGNEMRYDIVGFDWDESFGVHNAWLGNNIEYNADNFLMNVLLMQYTGLKDKNGVEIYEGDIIEYNGKANDHGIPWGWEFTTSGKGVVKYDLAGYLVFDLHTDNLVKENLNEFLIQYEEIDVIVIGNIYENPELLKEQNK